MPRMPSTPTMVLGIALIAACSEQPTAPADATSTLSRLAHSASATLRWNEIARNLGQKNVPNQIAGVRIFAYLSLAEYDAIVAAEDGQERGNHPSLQGAVTGASAVVLSYFYPGDATFIEDQAQEAASAPQWPSAVHTDFAAGEAIGRTIGTAAITRAQTDGFVGTFTGTVPTGPCFWFSSAVPPAPPLLPRLGQMKTYFLTSGSQFRPPPPPPCGSPAYETALDEVRQIALHRTAEQIAIAEFWAAPAGNVVIGGYWNQVAAQLIVQYHQGERKAAHTLALMNLAVLDAGIACWDAKYTYWFIRPSQADPSITPVIALPNHPSYPSGHACISGTATGILGAIFPSEHDRLAAMAVQAALSRIYAGIHYRFDADAGLEIARNLTAVALSKDVHGHDAFAIE